MLGNTHKIRRTGIILALAIAVAAFAAPAFAFDGRSPDTKDAALAAHQSTLVPLDGRSPDTKDAALAAQQSTLVPLDGRSPDTKDAAFIARYQPVTIVEKSKPFSWGDFGIGIAVAMGALLLLTGLVAGVREARHTRHPLGSA